MDKPNGYDNDGNPIKYDVVVTNESSKTVREVLEKHFCGWKDNYHLEKNRQGTDMIIAQAEAEINAMYSPMSEEEIESEIIDYYNEWLSTTDEITVCFKKLAHALYPHLRLSEAQINEVLPKKKEILPLSTDYRFGKSTQHSLWSYNQAIDDCKQALLNLGKGGGENGNIKQG